MSVAYSYFIVHHGGRDYEIWGRGSAVGGFTYDSMVEVDNGGQGSGLHVEGGSAKDTARSA